MLFRSRLDPEKGDLRALARRKGYRTVNIAPLVGGRFSVFGSVGLLPLALFGLDANAFLRGGAKAAARCTGTDDNPALELALALHAQHVDHGRNILVLMSYSDGLAWVGDWFAQLWGESLGKNAKAGSTPVRAVGATDQHSQLQLYLDGPEDKTVLFLRTAGFRSDLAIPAPDVPVPGNAYLVGLKMGELLRVESLATEKALTDRKRPNGVLALDAVNEESLGALLYFLQLVTVYAGALYGVDPFDQPAVEAGKRYAYGYFGRDGYAAEGDALRAFEKRPRKTIKIS